MANRLLRVLVGALLALPLLAVGTYAANASTGGTGGLRLVPGSLPGLSRATYLGAAPATQRVRVGISLQRPNSAGETALYQQLYDPSSPRYHQFLTPAQFDRMFGVPANQSAAVARWLKGGGITINTQSPAGDYVTATGTVAQLDRLFSVHIGDYRFQNKVVFSNDRAPSVPASLPIDAVVGLDDVHQFALPPLTKPAASAGTEGILTPQDLWGVYNDPVDPAHPQSPANTAVDFGQGQTMGIFGEGETSSVVAQLRLFEQAMGFPKIPVQSVETEGAPDSAYGDNSGAIEWYLDSQASTGMSPDASQLDLYFAKSLFDADIFADFDYWANDKNGPRQMNASFGECEENPTNPVTGPLAQTPYGTELGDELEAVGEPILRQATMEGRTLFASSGDTGSGCPELVVPVAGAGNGLAVQPVPMVSYPCVSAYAVCVGGTVVSVNGSTYPQSAQRSSETSWTFGGGGTSYFIPEPKFQHGVANVNHMCISTPSGAPYPSPPTCRGVPDVADLSGNVTGDGYFIYIDGEPSSQGGTSLSSPLMMGQWTRVQAAAPVNVQKKGGLGFADETIYRQALSRSYARDFYDVTQSEYGAGNGAYQPGTGWDYTSGWGALNVANFIKDVDGTTNAPVAEAHPAPAAVPVSAARMSSPAGNANDPVDGSLGNDPSLDLTGATLSVSASKGVVATLSGPAIGSAPPPEAGGGISFFVAWLYNNKVYYARANQAAPGSWTFTSGDTGTYGQSSTYGYNDDATTAATGTVDTAHGKITIDIPASEVGSPKAGALLADPQAFAQLNLGTPAVWVALTADSADNLAPVSKDGGYAESVGEAVTVRS